MCECICVYVIYFFQHFYSRNSRVTAFHLDFVIIMYSERLLLIVRVCYNYNLIYFKYWHLTIKSNNNKNYIFFWYRKRIQTLNSSLNGPPWIYVGFVRLAYPNLVFVLFVNQQQTKTKQKYGQLWELELVFIWIYSQYI